MDIRIGNDIRIDVTLENLGLRSTKNIASIECILINTPFNKRVENIPQPKPLNDCFEDHYIEGDTLVIDDLHCDRSPKGSKYSIHDNCEPTYNVYPCTQITKHFFAAPSHCGTYFNHDMFHHAADVPQKEYIYGDTYLSEKDKKAYMYFPSNKQRCGKYELQVKVTITDEGWKGSKIRSCKFDYGKVFKIVDDEFGQCGTIIIELPKYNNFAANIKTSDTFDYEHEEHRPSFYYGVNTAANILANFTLDKIKKESTKSNKNISEPFDFSGTAQIFYVLHRLGTKVEPAISQSSVDVTPIWYTDDTKFPGYALMYFNINGDYLCNSIEYYTD